MFDLGNTAIFRKHYTYSEFINASLFEKIQESFHSFEYLINKGYDNWIITFSGGKDSSTTLVLALEYIIQNPDKVKRIDVVYSDTLVEIPSIHDFAKSILTFLDVFSKEHNLNLYTHLTVPDYKDRFWVKVLGFGYPPPHQKFRWCTDRLKIKPTEQKLKKYFIKDKTAILTGVRYGESKSRDLRLSTSCSRGGECGQGLWFQKSDNLGVSYLAPIINWTSCEVWDYIAGFAPDKGYPIKELLNVYNGHETRFGCWMCTVVKQDKAMARTIEQEKWKHLKPLAEFRNFLWDYTRNPNTRIKRKDGYVGKLRLNTRKYLLKKLLFIQKDVKLQLISKSEIKYIHKIWNK